MSVNRENVIWKSRDGSWYRGFYSYFQTGEDYEWDVEYENTFGWASGPHRTEQEAHDSWRGANPGGHWICRDPSDETDRFDELFRKFQSEHPDGTPFFH